MPIGGLRKGWHGLFACRISSWEALLPPHSERHSCIPPVFDVCLQRQAWWSKSKIEWLYSSVVWGSGKALNNFGTASTGKAFISAFSASVTTPAAVFITPARASSIQTISRPSYNRIAPSIWHRLIFLPSFNIKLSAQGRLRSSSTCYQLHEARSVFARPT